MANIQLDLTASLAIQRSGQTTNIAYDSQTLADEAHDEHDARTEEIPDNTSDQAITLGPLTTIQAVLVISDQPVTFKINGDSNGFEARGFLAWGAAITAMTVSNASGKLAVLRLIRVGT